MRVAVARKVGKRCRFVRADGTLGPPRSCLRTSYLPARGGATWTLTLHHRLAPGTYIAWVRAIDEADNVERTARNRNRVAFRIR